eukprot:GHVL01007339.1.p1 GENE.GHVL01007339.1~~GHVL01007339.1.p1  ORF type:complete len:743 (-),score=154.53 GHVL01007339.1:1259-3214(-)
MTNQRTDHLKDIRDHLYKEMLSRIKETDEEVPYKRNNHMYYTRTVKGQSYLIHCRKQGELETVLVDVNELAKEKDYCDVENVEPSPDNDNRLAYAIDNFGNEKYDIRILDINTQKISETLTGHKISETVTESLDGGYEWGADSSILYYTSMDAHMRSNKVWQHIIGTPQSEDICLYTENDVLFRTYVQKSSSEKMIFIVSASKIESEIRFIDLREGHETAKMKLIQKRQKDMRYSVEHHKDMFYIITNKDESLESKLMFTKIENPESSYWQDVWAYNPKEQLKSLEMFERFCVISGRSGGLRTIWVWDYEGEKNKIEFDEETHTVQLSNNYIFDTDTLRLSYTSYVTPKTIIDYDMKTKKKTVIKVKEVPNYDPKLYTSTKLWAEGHDGVQIPILAVYNKKIYPNGITGGNVKPVNLYGYGSYGICEDPYFSSTLIPKLDRGVIEAVALVRGGGDLGRHWYEKSGKLLNKKNTFLDTISCAEHLIKIGVTKPERMALEGASAGGLLVGACLNLRPDLFKVALAVVPFVDVMTTMSDATIPLTVDEWNEWGNPNEQKYFYYLLEYSPVDNVRMQKYPSILAVCGLHDPRVAYWEPAKWVAKLREYQCGKEEILLKCDMSSGHFSASDRYQYLKEKAFNTAFVLDKLNALKKV